MPAPKQPVARTWAQRVGLALGVLLFLGILLFAPASAEHPQARPMAAVAALMAAWWISEALPLWATALLPLVLFPLLGILAGKATAPVYVNSTIFLFLGGFMIAMTMERWGLHRRMALVIIRAIGGGPARIVLGFMAAAAFLSMWISNTATAIMMVPIGLAIVGQMEARCGEAASRRFAVGLMIGIAYACSLGGLATLVGTPPNLSFARIFQISFPDAPPVTFGHWFVMALPLSLAMLALAWLLVTRVFFRVPAGLRVDRAILDREHAALGPMRFEERAVLVVFGLTALLWVFRAPLDLGFVALPGWAELLPHGDLIDDGTVAICMALTLCLVPTRSPDAASATVMRAAVVRRLPWDIVLLFGGGFALAKGFQVTGLAALLGAEFAGLAGVPPLVMVLAICLGLTFLTELTSNTATTEMVLPILASMAVAMGTHPLLLMVPATLSASCAFMMPVATPPNAIVFGSGRVRIAEMARVGLALNLIGAVVIALYFTFVGAAVFGVDSGVLPDWAAGAADAAAR